MYQQKQSRAQRKFGVNFLKAIYPQDLENRSLLIKESNHEYCYSKACSQVSNSEKGKIEIRPAIPFVPESTVDVERIDKNKDEFISLIYRYRPSARDSKKNYYVIKANRFET